MKRIFTIVMIVTLALPLFAFDFFFDEEETSSRNIALTMEGGVLAYVDDGELAPMPTSHSKLSRMAQTTEPLRILPTIRRSIASKPKSSPSPSSSARPHSRLV